MVIAGAGACLAGCGDRGALDGLSAGRLGRVSRVMSGDTLALEDGDEVRLAGVEAPHVDQPYGDDAARALERLAGGRQVQLMHGGARTDPFGRTVAHIRIVEGHRWLEGALIDAGAVRVRTFADNRALAKPMLAGEARARFDRRGLWALDAYRVRLPNEVDGAHGLTIVEGRIAHVGRTADGDLYLDFDGDWRSNFSAEVSRGSLRGFRSAGLDPMDLQGQMVRIRSGARGLRLVLDHPEQIERLRG